MAKSCIYNPGGHLWEDLSTIFPREDVIKYYQIGTSKEFKEEFANSLVLDENGEPTLESFRKVTGLDIKTEKAKNALNADIKAGKYSYNEAVDKVQTFNRTHSLRDEYMATLTQIKGNQYSVSVVERNLANEAALDKVIKARRIIDVVEYYIKEAGGNVEVIDYLTDGIYDTANATKLANGLYNIIRVSKGQDLEKDIAHEAGHFAIGALGNSDPLVQRLLKLCEDKEVQKRVLGKDFDETTKTSDPIRETAGRLVGQSIYNSASNKTLIEKAKDLVTRILDKVKRLFRNSDENRIQKAIEQANELSDLIANGFLSHQFTGDIETALETPEVLYAIKDIGITKPITATFISMTEQLDRVIAKLEAANSNNTQAKPLYADIKRLKSVRASAEKIYADAIAEKDEEGNPVPPLAKSSFATVLILNSIIDMTKTVADMFGEGKEIDTLIKNSKTSEYESNDEEFFKNLPYYAQNLLHARLLVKNAYQLRKVIGNLFTNGTNTISELFLGSTLTNEEREDLTNSLYELRNVLDMTISKADDDILKKERQIGYRFLGAVYGKSSIKRIAKQVVIDGKSIKLDEVEIPLSDFIDESAVSGNWYYRWLGSVSNSPDVISQLIDKAVKQAKRQANSRIENDWNILETMAIELKNRWGITDYSIFYEVHNGKLSGNFISKYNYAAYSEALQTQMEKWAEQFMSIPENAELIKNKDVNQVVRMAAFIKWVDKKKSIWKSSHWVKGYKDVNGDWIEAHPTEEFRNEDYDALMQKYDGLERWYNNLMALKETLDNCLSEYATTTFRAPQVKEKLTTTIKNRHKYDGDNWFKAGLVTIGQRIWDLISRDCDDRDFGSDNTTNSVDDDTAEFNAFRKYKPFEVEKKVKFKLDFIDRLPLFGINRIKDTSQLSTDIFYSMLCYSTMARQYEALSSIENTLKVTMNALERRKMTQTGEEDAGTSVLYYRLDKYLAKELYSRKYKNGRLLTTKVKHREIVWNKAITTSTQINSFLRLAGNIHGGIANYLDGMTELFKEVVVGAEFSLKDFLKASKLYSSCLGGVISNYGVQHSQDYISLLIRKYDMLGTGDEMFRNAQHGRARNMIDGLWYLPYKTGDHAIQAICHLALGNRIKVYDEDGNEMSLNEAYEVVDDFRDVIKNEMETRLARGEDYSTIMRALGQQYGVSAELVDYLVSDTTDEFIKENQKTFKALKLKPVYASLENREDALELQRILKESFTSILPRITNSDRALLMKHNINPDVDIHILKAAIISKIENLHFNEADESNYHIKARAICNRLLGVYNSSDKTILQQTILGQAIMSMKGYALGKINRRYGGLISFIHGEDGSIDSIALGHDSEGSIVTMLKVAKLAFSKQDGITDTGKLAILALVCPWTKRCEEIAIANGFSADQIANMKRNNCDLVVMILGIIIKALAMLGKNGEGDDDDNWGLGMIEYFITRLLMEQSAFNALGFLLADYGVTGLIHELPQILDLMAPGITIWGDIIDLERLFIGAQFTDKKNSDYYYQKSMKGKYEKGDAKWKAKAVSMTPYLKSWYTFNNPYQASKGYENAVRQKAK